MGAEGLKQETQQASISSAEYGSSRQDIDIVCAGQQDHGCACAGPVIALF